MQRGGDEEDAALTKKKMLAMTKKTTFAKTGNLVTRGRLPADARGREGGRQRGARSPTTAKRELERGSPTARARFDSFR